MINEGGDLYKVLLIFFLRKIIIITRLSKFFILYVQAGVKFIQYLYGNVEGNEEFFTQG